MSSDRLRGILAILVTPFTDDLELDEESHRAQVDFSIRAGAAGLITTAVYGEFFTLSDRERQRILRVTVDETAGRLPVIATTSGVSTAHAVELTRDACDAGADAIMAMPPYFARLPQAGVWDYFQQLSEVSTRPLILQNAGDFIGAPVDADHLARMFSEFDRLEYLKEEVPPNPHSVQAAAAKIGDRVKGIFGGHGGMYMITEHRRGATGWMPAPEFLEITVRMYELLEAGDESVARQLHARLTPGLVYERLLGIGWTKRVLQERGVIRSSAARMPGPELDTEDEYELDLLLNDLSDLLTTKGRFMGAT